MNPAKPFRGCGLTPAAAAALAFWGVLVLACMVVQSTTGVDLPTCLFKRITGLPCPTCGSTRAMECLVRGHIFAALAWNPLVVGLLVCLPLYLLLRRHPLCVLDNRGSRSDLKWAGAILATVACNWVYVILRGD